MATQARSSGEAVSIGRVLQRTFSVVAANPVVFLGIAFVFGALPGLALGYVTQLVQSSIGASPTGTRDYIYIALLSGLIGFALSMMVQGALVRATVAQIEGRSASFGESVVAALRVLLPLVGLSILITVAVALGATFMLVPGIMLYVLWSVASPALVEEQGGIGAAMGRSRRLTKGARWKVFGLLLIILVAYWLLSALLGLGAILGTGGLRYEATDGGQMPWPLLIINAVVSTLGTTFWSTAQTALYVELRDWKDGPTADHLADVFA